jgi:hypothetical protein
VSSPCSQTSTCSPIVNNKELVEEQLKFSNTTIKSIIWASTMRRESFRNLTLATLLIHSSTLMMISVLYSSPQILLSFID